MRQGTRTAWASLVLLVALTVGAASLSIATASSFSLASLSPSAALRYAVSATLDTSFTVSWSSGAEPVLTPFGIPSPPEHTISFYHPPDRCSTNSVFDDPGYVEQDQVVDIGAIEYSRALSALHPNDYDAESWEKEAIFPTWDACNQPTTWLTPLLSAVRVQRNGDVYQGEETSMLVASGLSNETSTPTFRVVIVGDHVVSETWYLTVHVKQKGKATDGTTPPVVISYGAFGSAPPVSAPPANEVGAVLTNP